MRKDSTKDPEYLSWLRLQPCCLCGRKAYGVDQYGNHRHQAAHHVNGRHNDHSTVPVCDTILDPGSKGCHSNVAHKHMRKWRPFLTQLAKDFREKYAKEVE